MGTAQEETNRDILKAFYSTFKAAAKHTIVFLTGVTKFAQVGGFSGFNQPRDISMDARFETICGITEEELYRYFPEQIKALAAAEGRTETEMKTEFKKHYDGYHFSRRLTGIYNPFSILNALDSGELRDFWFSTGTPTYLIRLMETWHENIKDLLAKPYDEAEFADYRATTERPLSLLYQSGYLTVKSYNQRRGSSTRRPHSSKGTPSRTHQKGAAPSAAPFAAPRRLPMRSPSIPRSRRGWSGTRSGAQSRPPRGA